MSGPILRDILLALRWAYYCKGISIVSDYEYDQMEKEYKGALPVGSSNPEDYSPAVRALGLYFILGEKSKPEDML